MTASGPGRVLMTADAVGGVWTHALTLCRGFAAEDVEVVLATMGPRPAVAQRRELASLGNVILQESDFALEWMPDPWAEVAQAADWLLALEERFGPDVVHLNGFSHAALPWRAPVLVAGHSCVLSWWRAVRSGEAPLEWNRYRQYARAGLRAANLVVAPSWTMLRSLLHDYGPLPNTRVIPNGRDPSAVKPAAKEPFVLSVGRLWDDAKNVRTLAAIAPGIAWPVRVAGERAGPEGSTCDLAQVTALGFCSPERMAAEFARASIYALPARYEPFGLSVLEAALSGCALVLGDIPSLRENWDGAAVFVPPEDRIRLRAALNASIHDEVWRNELSRQACARAQRFPARRMVDGYLEAYRSLRNRCGGLPQDEAIPA